MRNINFMCAPGFIWGIIGAICVPGFIWGIIGAILLLHPKLSHVGVWYWTTTGFTVGLLFVNFLNMCVSLAVTLLGVGTESRPGQGFKLELRLVDLHGPLDETHVIDLRLEPDAVMVFHPGDPGIPHLMKASQLILDGGHVAQSQYAQGWSILMEASLPQKST
jgi:hypothetical protein